MLRYQIISMSKASNWTSEEETLLWQLHQQYGNKWTAIAARMPSRNDAAIKNKFYSTIRKGLRKLNKYITHVKKKADPVKFKAYKTLQELFVIKLIAVSDNKYDEKYEVKQSALELASTILSRMIEVACNEQEYQSGEPENHLLQEKLLSDILEFSRNCKRRKGKKVEEERLSPGGQLVIQEESDQEKLPPVEDHEKKDEERIGTALPLEPQKVKSAFQMGVEEFMARHEKIAQEEEVQVISRSANLSQCSSWAYEMSLGASRELGKKFTQPSPLPSDDKNPFSFASIVKNRNITASNMFDLRCSTPTPANDNDKCQNRFISILDQLPLVPQQRTTEFFKSADLSKSAQLSDIDQENSKNVFSPAVEPTEGTILSNPFSNFSEYCFNPERSREGKKLFKSS